MYKTQLTSKTTRNWHLIDATNRELGRLSTEIAILLMGKSKIDYLPHVDAGDYVVLINLQKIKQSGVLVKKIRYTYGRHVGSLKKETYQDFFNRRPEETLYNSVKRMLPKNRTQNKRMKRLKIFVAEHKAYNGISFINHEKTSNSK